MIAALQERIEKGDTFSGIGAKDTVAEGGAPDYSRQTTSLAEWARQLIGMT